MKRTFLILAVAAIGTGAAFAGDLTDNTYATRLFHTKGLSLPGYTVQQSPKATVAVYKSGAKTDSKAVVRKPTVALFKAPAGNAVAAKAGNDSAKTDIWSAKGLFRPGSLFTK